MKKNGTRFVVWLVSVLVVLAIVLSVVGVISARQSFAQTRRGDQALRAERSGGCLP